MLHTVARGGGGDGQYTDTLRRYRLGALHVGAFRGRARHRGQSVFFGTLTFDDPSVADEAIVPNFSP